MNEIRNYFSDSSLVKNKFFSASKWISIFQVIRRNFIVQVLGQNECRGTELVFTPDIEWQRNSTRASWLCLLMKSTYTFVTTSCSITVFSNRKKFLSVARLVKTQKYTKCLKIQANGFTNGFCIEPCSH